MEKTPIQTELYTDEGDRYRRFQQLLTTGDLTPVRYTPAPEVEKERLCLTPSGKRRDHLSCVL